MIKKIYSEENKSIVYAHKLMEEDYQVLSETFQIPEEKIKNIIVYKARTLSKNSSGMYEPLYKTLTTTFIERTLKLVTVTITTARPGLIIGKGGQEVDKLKEELKKITDKDIQINIFEIKRPELDAVLVADSIAKQIENRISYRRAVKMAIAGSMRMGAEGIKVQISGRLNGAEMARSESFKEGRIPLSTFRADIDYHIAEAHTTYGRLGVKVWIMKGEVYGKRELSPLVGQPQKKGPASGGGKKRERK